MVRPGRRLLLLLAGAVLFSSLLASRQALRPHRLDRRRGGDAALSQLFSTREQIAAGLLGGFRALLINALWVRILWHVEHHRFLELPLYYKAVEDLQGASSTLYREQANRMVFDIAREVSDDPEARWSWIRRGLEILDKGNARFPGNYRLLRESGAIYYHRFHPERSPEDRRRFLADRALNAAASDPLDLAIGFMEQTSRLPEHTFQDDLELWVALNMRIRLLSRELPADRPPGALHGAARPYLEKSFTLLDHISRSHGIENDAGKLPLLEDAREGLRATEEELKKDHQHH